MERHKLQNFERAWFKRCIEENKIDDFNLKFESVMFLKSYDSYVHEIIEYVLDDLNYNQFNDDFHGRLLMLVYKKLTGEDYV